jgi:hypothetical protein
MQQSSVIVPPTPPSSTAQAASSSSRPQIVVKEAAVAVPTSNRLAILLAGAFSLAVVAIWLRNRDILRDLYDYSSVIVAAGKIEAGLRPYADFRSTMQSATYALNRGVELLFGANYLALTWGGLIVSLGGGAALAWLWRRSFGSAVAIILAGAIAVGGLSQHVVVFYNPVGLLCLAMVAATLAHDARLWRLRSPATILACLALVLGGTNKINFHAFTCGMAALLIFRAWWLREATGRSTLAAFGMLALCGIALPLGLELAWTGASLRQWADNVLILPSERVGFVTEFLRRDIITRPAYDIYHHFIFKRLTLAGLVLIGGSGLAAWLASAGKPDRWRIAAWLMIAVPVCALGGILLTVTNVESLALTSLSFLICAAAIWAALSPRLAPRHKRAGTIALALGSMLWTVVGGYAAWEGSRIMYGATEPQRGSFIRLDNQSPALTYLRGVRLDSGLYHSLRLAATELERLKAERGNLSKVLFGPAMEWLERQYPESVLRGMPVWYHQGTSLRPEDGTWLQQRLASRQIDRIVLNPAWESWPGSFAEFLAKHYRATDLGPVVRLYEARPAEFPPAFQPAAHTKVRPLRFCRSTHSNIHIYTTKLDPGMTFCPSPWGEFLGCAGSSRWDWHNGIRVMTGTFVAVRTGEAETPVSATWRVLTIDGTSETVLETGAVTLAPGQSEARANFELRPYGQALRFEVTVADQDTPGIAAGWRDLWILETGDNSPVPPPAAVDGGEDNDEEIDEPTTFMRAARVSNTPRDGWKSAPFEAWRECTTASTPWKVRISAKRRHDIDGSPTIIALVWYKAGRIEILREQMVNPDNEETVNIDGWMPEPGGWMGVFARAADIKQPPNCRVRIESWTP